MVELLRRQPAGVSRTPASAAGEDPSVTEQKREPLLALLAQILSCRAPNTHEVPHRLMHRVGNPDPAQLARPEQPGQGDGVAPVGLDVIARAPRDQ